MTRKITLVAVVAMLAMGTSAALTFGATPQASSDVVAEQETTTAVETTMMQTTTATGQASVTLGDQTSNGTAVVVEEVVVPEGGFVVIHEAESLQTTQMETEMGTETETAVGMETTAMDGQTQQYAAGPVLGNSTYLEPGVHEDVTVRLDEPIEADQVLIAMPHMDTNDNQAYEFPETDDPYTVDGQAVIDWANVTVEAGETTTVEDGETTTEM
ncbi:DUF7282 domain-containing protein [Halorussus pelagicus]|uniref:DUF7282 domain-containing protein n=1 Tax=Halorussus pelagicus TaxID=2505977 RepID=UPI000FFB57D4|nr:hypothetical protein [Halorussus pelagicus]